MQPSMQRFVVIQCKHVACGKAVAEADAIRLEALVRGPKTVSIGGNYCSTHCAQRALAMAAERAGRGDTLPPSGPLALAQ